MVSNQKQVLKMIDQTLDEVKRAEKILASARRFGFFDLFDGKDHGFLLSFLKRRRLNQANRQIERIEAQLKNLNRTLKQVNNAPTLDPIRVSWFWDMWFDNIFADWSSQRKIKKTQKKIKALARDLKQLRRDILG